MGLLLEGNVTTLVPKSGSCPPAIRGRAVTAVHVELVGSRVSEERFRPPLFHEGQWHLATAVSVLSFDHGNRSQFNGLLADSSIVAGVHHICHVLIGLGSLFHNQFGRGNADCDSHICQFVQDILKI